MPGHAGQVEAAALEAEAGRASTCFAGSAHSMLPAASPPASCAEIQHLGELTCGSERVRTRKESMEVMKRFWEGLVDHADDGKACHILARTWSIDHSKLLGSGGHGRVYEGSMQQSNGENVKVAVKVRNHAFVSYVRLLALQEIYNCLNACDGLCYASPPSRHVGSVVSEDIYAQCLARLAPTLPRSLFRCWHCSEPGRSTCGRSRVLHTY